MDEDGIAPLTVPAIAAALRRTLRTVRLRGVYVRVNRSAFRVMLAQDTADLLGVAGVGVYLMGGDIEVPHVIVRRDLVSEPYYGPDRDDDVITVDAPADSVDAAAAGAMLLLVRYRLGEELV